MEPDAQETLLRTLAERLAAGGALLVKDIATTPRWRWAVNRLHDRIVAGADTIRCRSPGEMAALISDAGPSVETIKRLRHPLPYPHYLIRARAVRRVRPDEITRT